MAGMVQRGVAEWELQRSRLDEVKIYQPQACVPSDIELAGSIRQLLQLRAIHAWLAANLRRGRKLPFSHYRGFAHCFADTLRTSLCRDT